ncbi:hypothetical protein ACHQM5_000267 [Ranunculus cassubicifolius]
MASFTGGDSIEVRCKEAGLMGSYYPATILKPLGKKDYLVQFQSLVADRRNDMVRGVVEAADIRPSPPNFQVMSYRSGDLVDVFDDDGWKVRSFDSMGEGYSGRKFRIHQEWKDGEWFLSRKSNKKI